MTILEDIFTVHLVHQWIDLACKLEKYIYIFFMYEHIVYVCTD